MIDLQIKDKKDCMGCYACSNICPKNCIYMISDNEGFWYPQVEYNECIKCGLCINACPIINKVEVQENNVQAYACINKEESIRLKSSSGGLFTVFAEWVIDNGGVVFGAGFDEDFTVSHSCVDTKGELEKFRGSKYVQSKIGDTYKQAKDFLKQGRKVLFTGTPCQIAGLKRYLVKNYDNLLCQDIICQGVPSPMVWKNYLNDRIKGQGEGYQVKKVSFREKDEGWKQYQMKIIFESDEIYQKNKNKDEYLKIFMKFLSIRPSCFECKFKGKYRESDITLADFWGIENVEPSMNDNKGTSLVLINTRKGQKLMNEIKGKMIYKNVAFLDSIKSNPMYSKSIQFSDMRNKFFEELQNSDFSFIVKKYLKDSIFITLINKAKRICKRLIC